MSNNAQKEADGKTRPPVVVVLGHVDHGKTTLLDTIRKTKVAEKESGGITQHIGAYQAQVGSPSASSGPKKLITFLDTPGHEAFTAIRSRGAKVADLAILVVAADEGVKPQTKEAIQIIKEADIPFVVAINKIDREGANSQKVKQDLAGEDVLVEDWGGKVPVIEISAKTGKNISELLDMILLLAELEELKEDSSPPAEGVIIESYLDKRRGYVATLLIQKGVLNLSDWIVAGTIVGKIKSMEDFTGRIVQEAKPSEPVLVTGWPKSPEIGRKFTTVPDKDSAFRIAEENINLAPLFSFFSGLSAEPELPETNKKKILNIVFKTDVSSSLEAIETTIKVIKSDEVGYKVVSYDIGNIGEADIKTAIATKSQVIGFRVGIDDSAKSLADRENVKISAFDVIYELIEYVRQEMASFLEPEIKRNLLGKLKILAVFKNDSKSQIVGGKVISGKFVRGAILDVSRNNNKIMTCKLGQLQHNKEEAPEVNEGSEAGLRADAISGQSFEEIKVGDLIEAYEEEKIARNL